MSNSSTALLVSSNEDVRLLVNTSGVISLKIWLVASNLRTLPEKDTVGVIVNHLNMGREELADSTGVHSTPFGDISHVQSLQFTGIEPETNEKVTVAHT